MAPASDDHPTPVQVPVVAVQAPGQAEAKPEREAPILELAKELGPPWWVHTEIDGATVNGQPTRAVAYDGPGWLLAGVMAGNKLDPGHVLTKSKLLELGEEAANIPIGVHTHSPRKG